MVKYFLILITPLLFISASVPQQPEQIEQGVITYAVLYPKLTPEMRKLYTVLPLQMTVTFRYHMMCSEVSTSASYSKTIINARNKDIAIIAHVSNRKILVQRPGLDPSQPRPKVFIEKTNDTTTIAGYLCKKAKVTTLYLDNTTEQTEIWYCESLGSPDFCYELNFEGLHGMLMRYTVKQGDITQEYTAIKVEPKEINKSFFDLPTTGYEVLTDRQFMHLMSK